MNDSLTGFNKTSIDFSVDGGLHWGAISTAPIGYRLKAPSDLLPTKRDPNRHTIRGGSGTLHSYDACSDPYLAADSIGRFFYSCIGFDIATNASLAFVTPSPAGAKGSYFDQVPAPFGIIRRLHRPRARGLRRQQRGRQLRRAEGGRGRLRRQP